MGKYLDTAGSHVELGSELLAEGRVGLRVILVHALEDLELGAGGALAVLDLVGRVRVEGTDIDLGRVHAWGNERGYARLVLLLMVVCVEGVGVVEVVESGLLLLQMLKACLRAGEGVRVVVHGVLRAVVVGEDVVESGLLVLVLVLVVEVGVAGGVVGGKIVRWDVCVVRVCGGGERTGVGEHLSVGGLPGRLWGQGRRRGWMEEKRAGRRNDWEREEEKREMGEPGTAERKAKAASI